MPAISTRPYNRIDALLRKENQQRQKRIVALIRLRDGTDYSYGDGKASHGHAGHQDRSYGASGCWASRMPRGTMAAAVIAALATCVLSFAPAVFAQRASGFRRRAINRQGRIR